MAFHGESKLKREFLSKEAKPVQVVDFYADASKPPVFKHEVFEEIIHRGNASNIPIYMVVITGDFRSGKSFLLNAMVNYLQYRQERLSNDDWECSSTLIVNGEWRQAEDSVTKGIWMWNVPFVYEREGDKIGLILVDVQGIEDPKKGDQILDKLVLYTSMELANVLILNTNRNGSIQTTDKMETAITFSSLFPSVCEKRNIEREALIVMIRDWQAEGAYGERHDLLESKGPQENVLKAYKHSTCFVAPYPGKKVALASTSSAFSVDDIEELDFKNSLKDLFYYLLYTVPHGAEISEWLNGKQTINKFVELSNRLANSDDRELLCRGTQEEIANKIISQAFEEGQEKYRKGISQLADKEKQIETIMELDDEMEGIKEDAVEVFKAKTQGHEGSEYYKECVSELTTPIKFPEDRECLKILKRLGEFTDLHIDSDSTILADFDKDLMSCLGTNLVKALDTDKRLKIINNSRQGKWGVFMRKPENLIQIAILVTLIAILLQDYYVKLRR